MQGSLGEGAVVLAFVGQSVRGWPALLHLVQVCFTCMGWQISVGVAGYGWGLFTVLVLG